MAWLGKPPLEATAICLRANRGPKGGRGLRFVFVNDRGLIESGFYLNEEDVENLMDSLWILGMRPSGSPGVGNTKGQRSATITLERGPDAGTHPWPRPQGRPKK